MLYLAPRRRRVREDRRPFCAFFATRKKCPNFSRLLNFDEPTVGGTTPNRPGGAFAVDSWLVAPGSHPVAGGPEAVQLKVKMIRNLACLGGHHGVVHLVVDGAAVVPWQHRCPLEGDLS